MTPHQVTFPGTSDSKTTWLGPDSNPEHVVSVLSISPFDEDHLRLRRIFSHSNWRMSEAGSYADGISFLETERIPVIITACDLSPMCWKDVLAATAFLPFRPLPRLIVTSLSAAAKLWSEVLNLGGYDMLEKPFDAREVFWVVAHAWLNWKAEGRSNCATRAPGLPRLLSARDIN